MNQSFEPASGAPVSDPARSGVCPSSGTASPHNCRRCAIPTPRLKAAKLLLLLAALLFCVFALNSPAQTPVLFSMQNLTGTVNNRSILITPDTQGNPTFYGTNLVSLLPFTLQPVNGQVITNLVPWGYTIQVDGWTQSAHIVVPASTSVLNVVSLLNTNQFSPLNIFPTAPAGAITNNQSGVNLGGAFVGNGYGLTNLQAGAVNGLGSAAFLSAALMGITPQLPNPYRLFSAESDATNDGSAVAFWPDLSGNGQNFTNMIGVTFAAAGIGGHAALYCSSGTVTNLQFFPAPCDTNCSVTIVYRYAGPLNGSAILMASGSNNNGGDNFEFYAAPRFPEHARAGPGTAD